MADELDPVVQKFVAEVEEYVEEVKRAADDTREFAEAAIAAKGATADLRDGAAEAAPALGHVRDEALEATEALKIYQDAAGRWRDASGRFATAAEVEAASLGHVRDEALEATLALRVLKDAGSGSGSGGLLSRLIGGAGGAIGGGIDSLGKIPMIGPLLANPFALVAVVAAFLAIGTELGALVTGLTAAGLGIGGFAALAIPAFKEVFGAVGDTRKQLEKLPEPVQQAIGKVRGLEDGFKRMSRAFEPTAFKALNEALGVANQLLPYLSGFAKAAAPAIEGLLGGLHRWAQTQQFQSFMEFMEYLSGPVITAIGSGMKGLAIDVFILMERFSKKDVINSINIAFRILGATLGLIVGVIMEAQESWDILTQKVFPAVRVGFDDTRHVIAIAGHDIAQVFAIVRVAVAVTGLALASLAHNTAAHFDEIRHDAAQWAGDVRHDFDTVRHAAATLAHDTAAHFDEARHDVAQWADDVRHDVDRVIAWFEALPGRIERETDKFGHLLVDAGKSLIEGLIGGIESMVGELKSRVEGLGSDVVGWAKTALGIHSPSKEFYAIGTSITAGLALGLTETGAQVIAKANTLASEVARAAASGSITHAEADALGLRIAAQMQSTLRLAIGKALDGSLKQELTTTGSITKASITALQQIWDAERGGLVTMPQASALALWVKADNQRLISLNHDRERIAKEIAAATAFAKSTTAATESTFDLAQASTRADGSAKPRPVGQIVSTLRADAGKIGRFVHRIKELARDGLNKAYLQQLIAMGPDQGGALAEEWARAGLGEIKQLNAAEADVARESARLGKSSADALYDSGVQAGKGFLSGLKAQKDAIEHLMAEIAASMVARLRKDLGISSPSRVMFEHGASTLQGYINGWRSKVPELLALVRGTGLGIGSTGGGYGGAYGGGSAHSGSYGGGTTLRPMNVTVPVTMNGRADAQFLQGLQGAVQEAILRFSLNNPNNGLITGGRL